MDECGSARVGHDMIVGTVYTWTRDTCRDRGNIDVGAKLVLHCWYVVVGNARELIY